MRNRVSSHKLRALLIMYRAGRPGAEAPLVEALTPIVHAVAKAAAAHYRPWSLTLADLVQEAWVGAWSAIVRWDPKGGAASNYIADSARGYVRHAVRDRLGLIRDPAYRQEQKLAPILQPLSLDELPEGLEDRLRALVAPGPAMPIEERLELENLIAEFPQRNGELVRLICVEGRSQSEVARSLGMSGNTISIKLRRILCKLRSRAAYETLADRCREARRCPG